jgi:hypothetical protein
MIRILVAAAALSVAILGLARASDLTSHVMAMCPMSVAGTTVVASDTVNGKALTFTTSGDVTELRTRVVAMARIHDEHLAGNSMNGESTPPSTTTVVDVEGGASIVIVPRDSDDLEALRAAIQASADRLQRNGCDMMGQTRR